MARNEPGTDEPRPVNGRVERFDDLEELREHVVQTLAEESGRHPDEFRADDLPMPDLDELETVPAEEFYGDN